MPEKTTKIDALIPDARNANRGTERGAAALERSLRDHGAGRSILIDKHNRVIAGNKTLETAAAIGLDDVLIVRTDGRKLVAVQRTDLDLDSPEARALAYADNRVGQLDLDWDMDQIVADMTDGVDLSAYWRDDELEGVIQGVIAEAAPGTDNDIEGGAGENSEYALGGEVDRTYALYVTFQSFEEFEEGARLLGYPVTDASRRTTLHQMDGSVKLAVWRDAMQE